MKKNIYLIIITIITVVCIIAGSLYHIGGFALGLFDNLIPRSDKPLGNVCTEELSVDEFSNLVFDTTISNINVKTGDSYTVSYKCNKLSLDTGVGEVNLNSLTASDAEFDTGVGDLYVTDCSFATCDVDGGTGNLSFENCAFDEMDIDGGTGNITVTSSQSLDGYMMDLDSGTGDITINGNDYDDEYEVNEHAKKHLVIDSGLGDIEVKY